MPLKLPHKYMSIACFLATLTVTAGSVLGAVSDPKALEIETKWVPEPKGRGTFGILFSCLSTLVLCAWTAFHPDIYPNRSKSFRVFMKLTGMFVCLGSPEMLALVAYSQWYEAKRVHTFWCKHFGVKGGSPQDRLGREGAFFVVMGGFSVLHEDKLQQEKLSSDYFIYLTQVGKINADSIDKPLIIDKGKASALAKLLVFTQAAWMAVQCTSRKLTGLPITLLEVHALLQVLCAIVMYVFWWDKPLDISEPLPIIKYEELPVNMPFKMPAITESTPNPNDKLLQSSENTAMEELPPFVGNTFAAEKDPYDSTIEMVTWGGGLRMRIATSIVTIIYGTAHGLAWNEHFPTATEQCLWVISFFVVAGAPTADLFLFIAAYIYWRSSGRDVDGSLRDAPMQMFSFKSLKNINRTVLWSIGGLHGCFFYFYVIGILFFILESFISLRSVPKGVYQTTPWDNYLPHF